MKARLKTIVLSALGAMAAFSAVTYSSCNNDKCKAIVCAYGGTCNEGKCICQSGYEGAQCETITRNRYLDVWQVLEKGTISTSAAQYAVAIEAGPNITDVTIKNFNNKVKGLVNARVKNDTLFIPLQKVDGLELQGIGYIAADKYYMTTGKMIVRYSIKYEDGRTNYYGWEDEGEISIWNH